MLFSKKRKIQEYLGRKAESDQSAFDLLLGDYLDGRLKKDLVSLGITKSEIHVDLSEDMKCIGIQGRYQRYFADIQIYPDNFCVSFDPDEPDNDVFYPLESREQVYDVISDTIAHLK